MESRENTEFQWFSNFFRHSIAVMLLIDPETHNIIDANPAAEKFYGWSHSLLTQMKISHINTLSYEEIEAEMQKARSQQRSYFSFKHRKADGSICPVEVFSSKITFDGKEYLHSIIHDITEQKKAIDAQHKSNELFYAMISSTPLASFSLSPEGTVLTWNNAAELMFGWSEQEAVGSILPIIPPHLFNEFHDIRQRVLNGEHIIGLEIIRQRKSGELFPCRLFSSPIHDPKGKPVGLMSMIEDITQSKKTEEALRFSENKFRQVFESANVGKSITQLNGEINVNQAFYNMLGYTADELKNKKWQDITHPDDIESTEEIIKQLKNGKLSQLRFEKRYIHKNGNPIWADIYSSLCRDGNNDPQYFITTAVDINAKKLGEMKLHESEQKYRHLFHNNPLPMWIYDLNTLYFLEVNEAAISTYGYTRNEFLSMTIKDIRPKDDVDALLVNIEGTTKANNHAGTWRHRKKDGTIIFVDIISHTIDYDGTASRLVLANNVTEKVKAEEELKHAHYLMQYIIEHNQSAVAVHDKNLKYIYVSQSYLDQYEVTEKNIIGKHHYDVFPDLPEKWRDVHRRCLNGEIIRKEEDPYIRANGKIDWTNWEVRPWRESDGSIGGIIVYTEVINQRKKMMEELRKLLRAVEQSPDSILITDTKGNIEYCNPSVLKVSGYTHEEIIGQNPRIFKSGNKTAKEYKELWETITAGEVWEGEFLNKMKNGDFFWEQTTISPVTDQNGHIINYLAIRKDISAQKKMTEELIVAKERAEESDRLKSAFLANMSHEIRTPLNSIMGFASLLPEEDMKETMVQYANIIYNNSEQLVSIIDGIVMYAKLQARQMVSNKATFELNSYLKNTFYPFSHVDFHAGATYHLDVSTKEELYITTDQEKFKQIIIILLSNAFKFTHQGEIRLGYTVGNNKVIFHIKDTGIGIPQKDEPHIYERFYRGSNVIESTTRGTGIGLSIASELTELLGGKIWFESNLDKGSTFYFSLPLS